MMQSAGIVRTALLALLLSIGALSSIAATTPPQATYASADEAVAALVNAVKQGDQPQLLAVLGPGSEALINSGDSYADAESRKRFLASYEEQHKLVPAGTDRMTLEVGPNDWPLPIPLVQANGIWHFDSPAGAQELVNRRIGRNEIVAIRTALAYVEAQKAYFALTGKTGQAEYARRLISTAGKHDGLYWPAADGEQPSPFAELVAQAQDEGYPGEVTAGKPIPYQGYMFHVLTAQGASAPGGSKDYIVNGRMIGGFALVAWPAVFGSSGIMTFVVNQDGVVFQKDLGPRTASIAASMTRFDPDLSWARVDIVNQ